MTVKLPGIMLSHLYGHAVVSRLHAQHHPCFSDQQDSLHLVSQAVDPHMTVPLAIGYKLKCCYLAGIDYIVIILERCI